MKAQKQFEQELDRVFKERTHWLRQAVVGARPGKPPTFDKSKLSKRIEKLQFIASQCLVDEVVRSEFDRLVNEKRQWHPKRGKGKGIEEKKRSFDDWFDLSILFPNYVYIFWADSNCKYVGRSVRGKGRPQQHFEKYWFAPVTRIDVYSTSKASEVPKLECLAIHRFNPSENKKCAAMRKWSKKCPICSVNKLIKDELCNIFRFK
jgi:hypothetical protein